MDFRKQQAAHVKLRAQALVAEIMAPLLPIVGVFAIEQIGKRAEELVESILEYIDTSEIAF